MKRLTLPKLAVILATLISFAWIVVLYAMPPHPATGPRPAIALAIPVGLGLWGLYSVKFRRTAGAALLVYALLVFFVSVWVIGLSYLPSAILLLTSKRAEVSPRPVTSLKLKRTTDR
jgi:hypothetical protein